MGLSDAEIEVLCSEAAAKEAIYADVQVSIPASLVEIARRLIYIALRWSGWLSPSL